MDNKERKEKALEYKHSGCNCCQAVLMAFSDKTGLDKNTLLTLGAGFGSGMGCMDGNCGALIGAVMADDLMNKRRNPAAARKILACFRQKCGSVTCSELKGRDSGRVLCSCDDCVSNAVEIISSL